MRFPAGLRLGVDDAGEGHAVGVVDDQRDVVGLGQPAQLADFLFGQHIAGGVGGPGDADGANGLVDLDGVKVDVVFEDPVTQELDLRPVGGEDVSSMPASS